MPGEYADMYLHIYFCSSKSNSTEEEAKIFMHCIFKKQMEEEHGLASISRKTKEAIAFQEIRVAI